MCDETTAAENEQYLAEQGLSRRQFGMVASAATLVAMLPSPANAVPVSGKAVMIKTPDGMCDAWFVAPTSGKHPGVLIWPDIMGLRPAFQDMARRLAESGYAVLVVNQFYRGTKAPFIKPGQDWQQPPVSDNLKVWRAALTNEAIDRDARAYVDFLDAQKQVDRKKGVGVTGYCMGGPMMVRTAAVRNDRVRAGGSFHGGGLVTKGPDSPHLLAPKLKGAYLFAVAANDDARAPTDKDTLRAAFEAAHVPAEIEVYAGTMHGWCPPDSKVYDQAQADRAWSRLLATFQKTL